MAKSKKNTPTFDEYYSQYLGTRWPSAGGTREELHRLVDLALAGLFPDAVPAAPPVAARA